MFATIKKVKVNHKVYEYIQIVENYRAGQKIKQRVIHSVGRKDKIDSTRINKLIASLETFSDRLIILRQDNPDLKILWSKQYGLPWLYHQLWRQIGFDDIIKQTFQDRKIEFNLAQSLFCLVLNRLMDPKSELGIDVWKDDIYLDGNPFDKLALQHLYRTLDYLATEKQTIEIKLFERTRNLFNNSVNLVFFDTTSAYFEGTGKHSHELQQFGYSKDHRPDRRQITVGVLLDQQGIPIGCEINSGNTQDSTAIKLLIDKVKTRFNLANIIWVSDSGMAGEDNIKQLHNIEYGFILGARMKNVKELYDKIEDNNFRKEMFAEMKSMPAKSVSKESASKQKAELRYFEFKSTKHDCRHYLIVYNQQEAEREKQTREAVIKKLEYALKQKNGIKKLIKNKKYKSYLKITGETKIAIDQDKAKKDERYDGLFVLQTDTGLSAEIVIARYKDLYQVEQAFRSMKSALDLRPIYHQKDRRVIAHVFVNFLALYLQITLKTLLTKQGLSAEDIAQGLSDIKKIEMSRLVLKDHSYHVRTELQGTAHKILSKLNINPGIRIQKL